MTSWQKKKQAAMESHNDISPLFFNYFDFGCQQVLNFERRETSIYKRLRTITKKQQSKTHFH